MSLENPASEQMEEQAKLIREWFPDGFKVDDPRENFMEELKDADILGVLKEIAYQLSRISVKG